MSRPASTGDLIPAGSVLVRIWVRYAEGGGEHVSRFPCYTIEVNDEQQDFRSRTFFFQETTFSPFVFETVGHLCDLLRSAGMEFILHNDTHLEL